MDYIWQYDDDDMSDMDGMIVMFNEQARDAKRWHDRAAAHRIESAEWALRIQRRQQEDAAEERRAALAARVMQALQEEAA